MKKKKKKKKKDLNSLYTFQVRSAKQLQGLPIKTLNSAAMALLGLLPVEACINKSVLTLFCNIARDPHCIEYDIAVRQLAVKLPNDNCFFVFFFVVVFFLKCQEHIRPLLPSCYFLIPPQKTNGKSK